MVELLLAANTLLLILVWRKLAHSVRLQQRQVGIMTEFLRPVDMSGKPTQANGAKRPVGVPVVVMHSMTENQKVDAAEAAKSHPDAEDLSGLLR